MSGGFCPVTVADDLRSTGQHEDFLNSTGRHCHLLKSTCDFLLLFGHCMLCLSHIERGFIVIGLLYIL